MTIGYLEDRIAKLEMEIQNLREEHEALVEGVRYLRNEIAKNQTVDAEPIRHGRWIRNDNGTYSCSECKSWIPNEQHYYARHCLFCGAKMDEEEE